MYVDVSCCILRNLIIKLKLIYRVCNISTEFLDCQKIPLCTMQILFYVKNLLIRSMLNELYQEVVGIAGSFTHFELYSVSIAG